MTVLLTWDAVSFGELEEPKMRHAVRANDFTQYG